MLVLEWRWVSGDQCIRCTLWHIGVLGTAEGPEHDSDKQGSFLFGLTASRQHVARSDGGTRRSTGLRSAIAKTATPSATTRRIIFSSFLGARIRSHCRCPSSRWMRF